MVNGTCGDYIVIEGLEGSGKTTATNVVFNALKNLGVKDIIFTRDPGGTKIAEKIRNILLDPNIESNGEIINKKTELLMFYAARAQVFETVIKPALKVGSWIIGDRHDLSTQAYQGGGRGINPKILKTLLKLTLGDFRPGLTLYLDVTPEIGLARAKIRGKKDRIEKESLEFFNRIRNRYLELASLDKTIKIIDATKSIEVVTSFIYNTVIDWFKK